MKKTFSDPIFQELIDSIQEERIKGNYEKVKERATLLEKEAIKMGNKHSEALAYYFYAVCELFYNKPMETIQYCLKGKEICIKEEYYHLYVRICMTEGTAYISLNERASAIERLLDGYYLSLKHSLLDVHAQVLNNIGSVFFDLGRYEIALDYYLKSYKIEQEVNDTPRMGQLILYLNIVNTYIRQKEFEEAIAWENKYLSNEEERKIPLVKYSMLGNYILMKYKTDTEEAMEEKVNEFLEYIQSTNLDSYFMNIVFEIIECCFDIKNFKLAKKIINIIELSMNDFKGYEYKERLLHTKTRLWEYLGEEEALYSDLLEYKEVVHKGRVVKNENECIGILSKIQLKEIEQERMQIELKNEELRQQSQLDSFTGVLNKVAFEEKVKHRLENNIEGLEHDVLIIIDIDNFKTINDVYGHAVGDIVIKKFAQLLKEYVRDIDFIGRIGGDEFAVLMTEVYSKQSAVNWGDFFMKALNNLQLEGLEHVDITVSMGAVVVENETDYASIFEKADKAMYVAKAKGKNAYEVYEED